MSRPAVEVADILHAQGDAFVAQHPWLSVQQRSVLRAIARCRTAAMGGHVDQCDGCGYRAISYNSCRNRPCPKCQAQARERWLHARERDLLDVPYVHAVFTLPHALLPLAYRNAPAVLRYLGRYTHRVAISNHRLLAFDGERVTFSYKDYAHGSERRTMTLSAMEFLRRFVQHILPRGFVRIRQSGFLANACRATRITRARTVLAMTVAPTPDPPAPAPPVPTPVHTSTASVPTPPAPARATWTCPQCGAAMRLGPHLSAAHLVTLTWSFDTS